ncbi:MAG: GspH/FimT family pseudopilin [Gammaproteobacteria bacterium]
MTNYMRHSKGFTLIELMVTLGIASIVLGMAAPAMRDMVQNSRITSQANELLASLGMARSEAVKRGTPVSICRSADLLSCSGGAGSWAAGWIVFDDLNGNGAVDGGEMVLRVRQELSGNPTLNGPAPVIYQPTAMVNAPATFTHTIQGCSGNQGRTVTLNATGRAMVTRQAC